MSALCSIAAAAALLAGATGALAQQGAKVTVQSLLDQGFQLVSSIATGQGAGLFFQNKDRMFFCVVAETPTTDVTTRYCKPVR